MTQALYAHMNNKIKKKKSVGWNQIALSCAHVLSFLSLFPLPSSDASSKVKIKSSLLSSLVSKHLGESTCIPKSP
jgi:hypothetical protein